MLPPESSSSLIECCLILTSLTSKSWVAGSLALCARTSSSAEIATATATTAPGISANTSTSSVACHTVLMEGILTQREGDLIDSTNPVAAQPFLPLVWATAISMRAEKDGYIRNSHALVNLIQVINGFRESLLRLFLMDKVCVPLVYTQVVTLAVYSYFLSSIIGRQFIVNTSDYSEPFRKDYYVPLYTILEFIVYMGWLKFFEHSKLVMWGSVALEGRGNSTCQMRQLPRANAELSTAVGRRCGRLRDSVWMTSKHTAFCPPTC
ncbi:Bestrophin-2 [Echinococcus granulosus]|uniref:Bestrophin homolog n=1 Tax=Echinococcus granulosus TaxID=6210 RepID=W6UGV5_ECHGR|nr:Bestrophin-2 [Echinococcus granulosus]EUB60765.1 Bestrophin-2 [Echinococcus granulosus]